MNGEETALLRNDVSYIREAVKKIDKGWISTLADVRANQLEIAKQQSHLQRHCGRMDRMERDAETIAVEVKEVRKDVRKVELTVTKWAAALGGSAGIGGLMGALVQALTQ